jgi:16S rRNA (uracil1498-N3)-methyltransferase
LTLSELDQLRDLPFSEIVSLGARILRAETAAIAAISVWQAICGEWCQNK